MSYRLLLFFLWPVFLIYTIKIALRDKSRRYFFQRLGFNYPQQTSSTLWIHCASVGEVNTYIPLHLQLLKHYPDSQFVITTNTTTGAETVKRHAAERTTHCFLPIESSFAIKRFLKAWQPTQCLIMETEIWPLLYQHCRRRQIPLKIINARLSHRTLRANRWIKSIYKNSLAQLESILCKSTEERDNYLTLGATEEQLIIAGNLKFAYSGPQATVEAINLQSRAYCVAASTHNDEEFQLAKLWQQLNSDRLLVIVPRHPNRSQQIQQQLDSLKLKYAVRSQQQNIENDTLIYLADTLGELGQFMKGADFIFIGGSLIEHGGQNILEPARLGKATACGPHMFNFKDEMQLLLKHQGCIQVNNTTELASVFNNWLNHPEQSIAIGENAKNALNQQSDILQNYLQHLAIQA